MPVYGGGSGSALKPNQVRKMARQATRPKPFQGPGGGGIVKGDQIGVLRKPPQGKPSMGPMKPETDRPLPFSTIPGQLRKVGSGGSMMKLPGSEGDRQFSTIPGQLAKTKGAAMGPKPQQEGESQGAYDKRASNFAMSQDRLKSVGISGGVNNASASQIKAFTEKYGHAPSGYKAATPAKPTPAQSGTPRAMGTMRGARGALSR